MKVYSVAKEIYSEYGVDTESVLKQLAAIPLSLHCWQGDDVVGFESRESAVDGGGIQATGNYPGRARSLEELRQDLDKVLSLLPGRHRVNLHASYADLRGKRVDRNELTLDDFQSWIDWAKERGLGLDFNPTFFAHPRANGGSTLSSRDSGVRDFWIEHGRLCRRIGCEMGKQLGSATITNIWIPDGSKDCPVDRLGSRQRLRESLDSILSEPMAPQYHRDAVESKLFGIGSESFVVGSHEFYLGYAAQHQILYCLDAGHFHPTESLADKISSTLLFVPEILLHVSRGVRWDSDHVVILDDPTRALAEEVVRGGWLDRTHIGLDYFDASINRIAAWSLGARSTLKALLIALLEPTATLRSLENSNDYAGRLLLLEEIKSLPWGLVWNEYLLRSGTPSDLQLLKEIRSYETKILSNR